VALHQAAFGTQTLTAEYRRTWMQVPGYHPALDLVAAAPDGSLAAYVFYSIQAEENDPNGMRVGVADSVGTHPVYRQMGLARALLLAGLPILKDLGVQAASLTTASYNCAMQQTASGAGFYQTGQILYFAKALHGKENER
jgi:GNAT superfamily N-acetyltransferase